MYLIVGLLIGLAFGIFAVWSSNKGMKVRWFEWVLLVIGALLLIFTAQNFFAGFEETVPKFSWLILATTGLLGLIFIAIPVSLIVSRRNAAKA